MGIESKIVAATGFQRGGYEKNDLVNLFKETLKSTNKFFEFTKHSLRGAKDIFDKGGQVVETKMDQTFRMFHDGRRSMVEPYQFKNNNYQDLSENILDSEPLYDTNQCKTLRFLSKFPITLPYNKQNTNRFRTKYETRLEVGVRNFIKCYYSQNQKFGLKGDEFKHVKDLISFIYGFLPTKGIKISQSSISHLKNRRLFWKPVPSNKENLLFVNYIKKHYPYFRDDLFVL